MKDKVLSLYAALAPTLARAAASRVLAINTQSPKIRGAILAKTCLGQHDNLGSLRPPHKRTVALRYAARFARPRLRSAILQSSEPLAMFGSSILVQAYLCYHRHCPSTLDSTGV